MARRCFFSFHYEPDNSRAAQVRNMGMVDGNRPVSDNDWEDVTRGGDRAIQNWIGNQLYGRSCTVVLVGTNTAKRKWIDYEIIESWNRGMGVVGIHIHGLRNLNGRISRKGLDPFAHIAYGNSNAKLSSIVRCYNPQGTNSKARYAWIKQYLADAVEEAIQIRHKH